MHQSESLSVEWRAIDTVRPYPGNPRIISETAIRKVAASIREFGWRQPIVVDEDGEILVGHARRLAALHLQAEKVPVHVAHGLSEAQKRAYRLADNRTHEEAVWDPVVLNLELASIGSLGFDLSLTGFDPVQLPTEPAPMPDFQPSTEPTSPPLDKLTEHTCPSCGHVFQAGARR